MGNTDVGLGNWLDAAGGTAARNHIRTLLKIPCKDPLGKPTEGGIFERSVGPSPIDPLKGPNDPFKDPY